MFLSSIIEELCTKEENNKAGSILTFGGQCISFLYLSLEDSLLYHRWMWKSEKGELSDSCIYDFNYQIKTSKIASIGVCYYYYLLIGK